MKAASFFGCVLCAIFSKTGLTLLVSRVTLHRTLRMISDMVVGGWVGCHSYQRNREADSVSVKRRVCSISEVRTWNLFTSSSTFKSSCSAGGGVAQDWRKAAGKKASVLSHHLCGGQKVR